MFIGLLGMSANAPQTTAYEFLIVFLVILGLSPSRFLSVCYHLEKEGRHEKRERQIVPGAQRWYRGCRKGIDLAALN
jgi:hypothetical protein